MSVQTIKRYSNAELEIFKALIIEKLELANQDLEFLKKEILELNDSDDKIKLGDLEDGSKTVELEYLVVQAARKQQFIKYLKNALIRIANKTYGVCSVTGQLISKERLMLVPHATKSVLGKNTEQLNAR